MNMTRPVLFRRMLLSGIALALAASSGLVVVNGADATVRAEDSVEKANPVDVALSDLRTCLSREGSVLDVYYLIDNSRSNSQIGNQPGTGTDVDGLRFKAVVSSLQPLIDLTDQGTSVNVAAGLFSKEGTTVIDWITLSKDSDEVADRVEGVLSSTEAGGGTNWAAGIREAEAQLRKQNGAEATHCQTLVWVTDGGIDIVRSPERTAEGVQELCGVAPTQFETAVPQGLMYSLRNAGVIILGVLLQDPDALDAADDDSEGDGNSNEKRSKTSYFAPVVEGSGEVDASYFNSGESLSGDFYCGEIKEGAQGATITIASADEIAREFQQLVTCIADSCTVVPPSSVVCEGGVCEIPIPKGIAELQISVPKGFDTANVLLPSGGSACLAGGCSVEGEAGDREYIRVPVKNVAGIWKVKTNANSISPVLFSGLTIDADPIEVNPLNPKLDVQLRVEQGAGAQFDRNNYSSPFLWEATVLFSNGDSASAKVTEETNGWRLNWESDANGVIPVAVEVSFVATAAGVGAEVPELRLAKIEKRFEVTKQDLENYPSLVSPAQSEVLLFTPINGLAGVAKGTVIVRGPLTNDGAICWASTHSGIVGGYDDSANRPSGTLTAQIDTAGGESVACPDGSQGIKAPQGEEVAINIELRATEQADALVEGTLNLEFFGPVGEEGFQQDVPFNVETTVVKSGTAFWLVLTILTLLGVGLPYLALVAFARRQAAFSSKLDGTRWASLPATVGQEGLLQLNEIDPSRYEFIFVKKDGITRKVETGAEVHEVIPPGWWPFRPPKTVVRATQGSSIFTNHDADFVFGRNIGLSSQVLGNVFYFVVEAAPVGDSPTNVQQDDWGNPINLKDEPGGSSVDSPRSGRLVVMASGEVNPADSIAKALAKVRTWSGWPNVHAALLNVVAEPDQKSKKSKSGRNTNESSDNTGTTPQAPANQPVTGFEDAWGFGAATPAPEAAKDKKSKFGRKNKKESSDPRDSGTTSGINFSDW